MEVFAGDPERNVKNMLALIEKAKISGVELIAFPEMCIGGYCLGDKFNDDSYCEWLMSFNDVLKEASDGIAVIYGNVFMEPYNSEDWHPNKDGRTRKYNAAYIFQNKKEVQRKRVIAKFSKPFQPKTLLPNYRFFDDERYFFSLPDVAADLDIDLKNLYHPFVITDKKDKKYNVGTDICEGLWCRDYRVDGESLNATRMLTQNGADFIVNISASPWTHGKNKARDNAVKYIVNNNTKHQVNTIPFFYVNNVGTQNNGKNFITFDGGSTVYNHNGDIVALANQNWKEEVLTVDFDKLGWEEIKIRPENNPIEEKYNAIITGLKHFENIIGSKPKWVIGISGGIDSALNACLLVDTFGKENVIGVNIPTKYNSNKTKNAAAQIANNLGIRYEIIPIGDILGVYQQTMTNSGIKAPTSLNEENEQARIRGAMIIAGLAARENALFTCNANKLEVALGYTTAYGDLNGAIAPLGDLTKKEVIELAKFINKKNGKEIIPSTLFPDKYFRFGNDQIIPSAELKENQIDPMKFGYHDSLIEKIMNYKASSITDIMEWYLAGTMCKNLNIDVELMKRWNVDSPEIFLKDIDWLFSLIQKNVFKRILSPSICSLSKSSYGFDFRESQLPYRKSAKYFDLALKIKNMSEYKEN